MQLKAIGANLSPAAVGMRYAMTKQLITFQPLLTPACVLVIEDSIQRFGFLVQPWKLDKRVLLQPAHAQARPCRFVKPAVFFACCITSNGSGSLQFGLPVGMRLTHAVFCTCLAQRGALSDHQRCLAQVFRQWIARADAVDPGVRIRQILHTLQAAFLLKVQHWIDALQTARILLL